jgi:hypothetical protein
VNRVLATVSSPGILTVAVIVRVPLNTVRKGGVRTRFFFWEDKMEVERIKMKAEICKWIGDQLPPFSKQYFVSKESLIYEDGFCVGNRMFYLLNNGQWSESALPGQENRENREYDESKPHGYFTTIKEAEEILKKLGESYTIVN